MKPWREVAVPNHDVLTGTFSQSEFAADIRAGLDPKSPAIYRDSAKFFERTYITDGMRLLLTQVAQRLSGAGGEPVIQLQTAFGGGKTHTLLAVYHLATRACGLRELAGIPPLLDQAGLMDVPRAQVAILDGNAHSPGQPWSHGGQQIRTLWGELAWQLGGPEAFALVRAADAAGTSPGKDVLRQLLSQNGPCVVLVDELVAYIRQFRAGRSESGGTYDSNLSFIQALTEAVKLVPNAILLASLPESEVEAGSAQGVTALRSLEKVFGRVQALWRPVATEEAFEIVRRRLFEPIRALDLRDRVCRKFAELYRIEGERVPSETQEARYYERMLKAYPIHPEVFDRLFEDWATLDGFQRTRGVLKLMAQVIYRLWKDQNKDLMILPASIPLYDGACRNELTYLLQGGWDPVIEKDIDGERAEATELDTRDARFGTINAARRAARTLFLGSAPSSASVRPGTKGLDRARILLGCLQPGQAPTLYSDALNRLSDRLHYLNVSGDKSQDETRFWFDTRANLRREMEERKGRLAKDTRGGVRSRIAQNLGHLTRSRGVFDGIHIFTPHSDVPDDGLLRLVVLDINRPYTRLDARTSADAVTEYVRNNGGKPRFRGNRLVFLAADSGSLKRLKDAVCTALAWGSIVGDINSGRLNIDRIQENQAKKELETADAVVARATGETFRWLLCPVQNTPTDRDVTVEAFPLNTSGSVFTKELDRVCQENELVVTAWSPIHLRGRLQELYWKPENPFIRALAVWEDMQRYLYLPRLKERAVFDEAVRQGLSSTDFFGAAFGQEGEHFEGFSFGQGSVQVNDTLLLIEPGRARSYQEAQREKEASLPKSPSEGTVVDYWGGLGTDTGVDDGPPPTEIGPGDSIDGPPSWGGGPQASKPTTFFSSADVSPTTAKMKLVTIAEEIISLLASDPNAQLKITLEVQAEFPKGAPEHIRRAVSENANVLGLVGEWE